MSTVTTEALQAVVFSLIDNKSNKREEYGVSIEQVQEIRVLETITRVPKAPEYVRGVTNLRGKIISIIDVKQKLGFSYDEIKPGTRILVAEINGILTGLLVDEVDQVMRISTKDIEAPPSGTSESQYVKGIAKTQNRLIIILDLQKLLEEIDNKSHRGN
ncbi:MAG: purine-binding chemotaxis protein CheW [Thaumarchaeota archaeon]|nr:purine-binding chemotaxis protein CheW [Nitrososphaerota archaeon]MBI3641144.1 purine-binding chemotaxis protein CheW [Nitrososphaerota archaeon]